MYKITYNCYGSARTRGGSKRTTLPSVRETVIINHPRCSTSIKIESRDSARGEIPSHVPTPSNLMTNTSVSRRNTWSANSVRYTTHNSC